MNRAHTNGAEAWPISREGTDHRPILEKILIASKHLDGRGIVHLTPDQALYAQSRLSAIAVAFLHGHAVSIRGVGIDRLPDDHAQKLSECGAKVWPIVHQRDGAPPVLEQVAVESEHPAGHGLIHLSPEQARYIHERLTHITLAFLHDNVWGGEDARMQ
jgi:hypothetical protein